MKYNSKRVLCIIAVFCLIIETSVNVFAHSGRTDAYGGHKDNKNKSGLGSYHYHCGGYPAHLHDNGICPYDIAEEHSSNIEDDEKETDKTVLSEKEDDIWDKKNVSLTTNNNVDYTRDNTNDDEGSILGIGALGGVAYLGYRKYKKSKK